MKTLLATTAMTLALLASPAQAEDTVHCMAYTPECGFPAGEPAQPVAEPLPPKCWKKHYRHDHKRKCRNYSYWRALVGTAR